MIVNQFYRQHGIAEFDEYGITTSLHSHPALEIAWAIEGTFDLHIKENKFENIEFGYIPSNIPHAIKASNAKLKLFIIDELLIHTDELLAQIEQIAAHNNINLKAIAKILDTASTRIFEDDRISELLEYIHSEEEATTLNRPHLSRKVFLSESRLSHLFKSQTGISLQQYLQWHKLKKAVKLLIYDKLNLTNASYRAGFYDAADFSKKFKSMMGLSPSKVYNNSIIIQD